LHTPTSRLAIAAAYTTMCLIWGSTWMMIKVGLRGAPPMTGVGVRFIIAGVLVGLLVTMRRIRVPRTRHFLLLCVFLGIGHMALPYVLVYWAEQYISSGLTAVLYSTMPLAVATLARIAIGDRLTATKIAGIFTGIVGVSIIYSDSLRVGGTQGSLGVLAVLGSVFFASLSSVTVKKYAGRYDPMTTLLIPFWIAGALVLAVGVPLERSNPLHFDAATWGTIVYLAALGSVTAFTLLFWVIKRVDVTMVAYQTFIIPVIAIFLGSIFLDETVSARVGLGTLSILIGIALATFGGRAARANSSRLN
jgi:drug/metabolite transporter (DMT)-like permease